MHVFFLSHLFIYPFLLFFLHFYILHPAARSGRTFLADFGYIYYIYMFHPRFFTLRCYERNTSFFSSSFVHSLSPL